VVSQIADAADEMGLVAALDQLVEQLGEPEVLVYNAGLIRADRPWELNQREHQDSCAVNVLGALTAATISHP
jgi:NADP-dependent 3-hydroxy acid dehydrogenase YdfG